jgi:hypothetical protein
VPIHLSLSEDTDRSLTSAAASSDLLLRLHNWLHELDFGAVGVIWSEDSAGRINDMIVYIQRK